MRCPRCGNDVTQFQYECHVCGTILNIEPIEVRVPMLFRRHEERWKKPYTMKERFRYILTDPPRAFWDIVHKPTVNGVVFTFFMNALIFGLTGIILLAKLNLQNVTYGGNPYTSEYMLTFVLNGLGLYIGFVLIGIFYFGIMWMLIIMSHTITTQLIANILPKWRTQSNVLLWAFFPSIFATIASMVVILVGLPMVTLIPLELATPGAPPVNIVEQIDSLFFFLYSDRARIPWMISDIIQIGVYCGYSAILMTIAYRELYEKSTTRVLASIIISSLICAAIFIYTRSSFPIGIFQG
nr:hypothetical protein [Candidatus Sigynarchaeota archaeon]